MIFILVYSDRAKENLKELKCSAYLEKHYKAVKKALFLLAGNPKHPSLNTHPYSSLQGSKGEKVFEAYAENNTPGAYRIFFYYGVTRSEIIILSVEPHP